MLSAAMPGLCRLLMGSVVLLLVSGIDGLVLVRTTTASPPRSPSSTSPPSTRSSPSSSPPFFPPSPPLSPQEADGAESPMVQDADRSRPSSQDGGLSLGVQGVNRTQASLEDTVHIHAEDTEVQGPDGTHSPLVQDVDGTHLSQFQDLAHTSVDQDLILDVSQHREEEKRSEERMEEERREEERREEERMEEERREEERREEERKEEERREEERREEERKDEERREEERREEERREEERKDEERREEERREEERREEERQRMQREKEEERARFLLSHPDPYVEKGEVEQGRDSSQEASGFFTEDSEDKRLSSARLWEEPDERNVTRPGSEALIEDHPHLLQTSTADFQEARQPNLTSLLPELDPGLDAGLEAGLEALERELWEQEEGQASGLPLVIHPGDDLSTTTPPTTAAAVAGLPSSTPSDLTGLWVLQGRDDEEEEEQAKEEEEEKKEGRPDLIYLDPVITQNPTMPEVGAPPSREPLQPGHALFVSEEEESEEADGSRSDWEKAGGHARLTTVPSPSLASTVGFDQVSWDRLDEATPPQGGGSEVRGGATELLSEAGLTDTEEEQQVVCVDWSELAGRGYVILNTTENLDCDEFREESGPRLLELVETVFSRRMSSPQGSWLVSLSKTPRHDHQLLMTLASQHGVIATKDVLAMLGEIRKGLLEVGIQNYSAASTCHSRPSQTRSDYGKLFVVLVIIGSVCMVIITSGLIYICWQRQLPKTKTMSRGEELHFVENGCHDNPTLDVMNDSQPEMQEKKPSTNGMAAGGVGGGEEGSRWKVLVNQPEREEDDMEEDTHL